MVDLISNQGRGFNLLTDAVDYSKLSYSNQRNPTPLYKEKIELLAKYLGESNFAHAHIQGVEWQVRHSLELDICDSRCPYRWYLSVNRDQILGYLGKEWSDLIYRGDLPSVSEISHAVHDTLSTDSVLSAIFRLPLSPNQVNRIERVEVAKTVDGIVVLSPKDFKVVATLSTAEVTLEAVAQFVSI